MCMVYLIPRLIYMIMLDTFNSLISFCCKKLGVATLLPIFSEVTRCSPPRLMFLGSGGVMVCLLLSKTAP